LQKYLAAEMIPLEKVSLALARVRPLQGFASKHLYKGLFKDILIVGTSRKGQTRFPLPPVSSIPWIQCIAASL